MFDWNDLKAFLAVAREGSTLGAARSMRVNQTTVGRRIEALEAAVGLKLFERGQTGSRLTEAGQDLLAEAERMEQAAAGFANRVAGHQRGLSGVLRVTSTEILANLAVTPSLAAFRRAYPDIQVDLAIDDLPLDLEAGEADVAIRAGIALTVSDLVARKVAEFDFALYASRDYVLRKGLPTTLQELREHDLIAGEGTRLTLPGVAWMLKNVPDAEPVARCNSMTSLLHTLKAGVGMAPFGCLVADVDPDLVRCWPVIPEAKAGGWIVTRADMTNVPRVRAFSDFMAASFAAIVRDLKIRGEAEQARKLAEIAAARDTQA